jgi:hypothetical protein
MRSLVRGGFQTKRSCTSRLVDACITLISRNFTQLYKQRIFLSFRRNYNEPREFLAKWANITRLKVAIRKSAEGKDSWQDRVFNRADSNTSTT